MRYSFTINAIAAHRGLGGYRGRVDYENDNEVEGIAWNPLVWTASILMSFEECLNGVKSEAESMRVGQTHLRARAIGSNVQFARVDQKNDLKLNL